jgi:DNA-binding NarL/FixJ family response regulator
MPAMTPGHSTKSETRRIGVVDDDESCREAVRVALAGHGWQTVPFETAASAVNAARNGTLPSLVLMDMSLPGESAGRAIADILRAQPGTQPIVLSSHQREDFVFEALRAGAVGYVLKQHALEHLAAALEIVESGGSPLSPGIARRVLEAFRDPKDRFEPLSDRERDILIRFAAGKSYAETAEELAISIDTVRTHVRRMYAKLHVRSRPEAVLAALRRGLLG